MKSYAEEDDEDEDEGERRGSAEEESDDVEFIRRGRGRRGRRGRRRDGGRRGGGPRGTRRLDGSRRDNDFRRRRKKRPREQPRRRRPPGCRPRVPPRPRPPPPPHASDVRAVFLELLAPSPASPCAEARRARRARRSISPSSERRRTHGFRTGPRRPREDARAGDDGRGRRRGRGGGREAGARGPEADRDARGSEEGEGVTKGRRCVEAGERRRTRTKSNTSRVLLRKDGGGGISSPRALAIEGSALDPSRGGWRSKHHRASPVALGSTPSGDPAGPSIPSSCSTGPFPPGPGL